MNIEMIIVSRYLIPKGYLGMTIYPFVLLKRKELRLNRVLINHERIHLRQQLEMLILPFFVWYIMEFLIRLIQFGNVKLAYRNISFEREAYTKEIDVQYLGKRWFWSFIKYL